MKRGIYLFSTLLFLIFLFQSAPLVSAERVIGVGAMSEGADQYRTNKFKDNTIVPPLGLSWSQWEPGAYLKNGFSLTNYRMYYGNGYSLYGRNDQTGAISTPSQTYAIGNPFIVAWGSTYGSVSTPVEIITKADYSDHLFFGTNQGRLGRSNGLRPGYVQGDPDIEFTPYLANGEVTAIGAIDYSGRAAVLTKGAVNVVDINNMTKVWEYVVPSGNYTSGVTAVGYDSMIAVTNAGSNSTSYGFGWWGKASAGGNPTYQITYRSGIPKAPTVDPSNSYVYTVDALGRFYIHFGWTGNPYTTYGFVGDSSGKGYESVGGVLLHGGYAYASSLSSSTGSQGTITRFALGSTKFSLSWISPSKSILETNFKINKILIVNIKNVFMKYFD